jgi:predicted lipid-binding transport protein (Tim44 family)
MRLVIAILGAVLLALPAAAQPFILPLKPQQPAEATPQPSPAPVAPPQSGSQAAGSSQSDGQPVGTANSSQASGNTPDETAPRAPGQ